MKKLSIILFTLGAQLMPAITTINDCFTPNATSLNGMLSAKDKAYCIFLSINNQEYFPGNPGSPWCGVLWDPDVLSAVENSTRVGMPSAVDAVCNLNAYSLSNNNSDSDNQSSVFIDLGMCVGAQNSLKKNLSATDKIRCIYTGTAERGKKFGQLYPTWCSALDESSVMNAFKQSSPITRRSIAKACSSELQKIRVK